MSRASPGSIARSISVHATRADPSGPANASVRHPFRASSTCSASWSASASGDFPALHEGVSPPASSPPGASALATAAKAGVRRWFAAAGCCQGSRGPVHAMPPSRHHHSPYDQRGCSSPGYCRPIARTITGRRHTASSSESAINSARASSILSPPSALESQHASCDSRRVNVGSAPIHTGPIPAAATWASWRAAASATSPASGRPDAVRSSRFTPLRSPVPDQASADPPETAGDRWCTACRDARSSPVPRPG
jgi:hypothetical protein